MKKMMMMVRFATMCLLPMNGWGHGFGSASLCDVEWTPVQIGIWPFVVFSDSTSIYGVNLDGFIAYQTDGVYGLSVAPLDVCQDNYGVSTAFASYMLTHVGLLISLLSKVEYNCGVQVGAVNSAGGGGLQIGVYNHAKADWRGVQIGLVNYIEDGGRSTKSSSSNHRTGLRQITERNYAKSPNVIDLYLRKVVKYTA